MALTAVYLGDKSALARMPTPAVRRRLEPLLVNGLVATCGIGDLEVGYSARNADTHAAVVADRRARCHVPHSMTPRSTAHYRSRVCSPDAVSIGSPYLI